MEGKGIVRTLRRDVIIMQKVWILIGLWEKILLLFRTSLNTYHFLTRSTASVSKHLRYQLEDSEH